MAIDTKAKRASVQAYTMGLMRPPPTGTVGEGARATVAWLYAGLDYYDPTANPFFGYLFSRLWLLHIHPQFFK